MPMYLVDFSLRHTKHDYAPLWQAMDQAGAHRAMDTTWFLPSTATITEVTNALLRHVDPGDRLLVVEIANGASWSATHMEEDTKAWLRTKLNVAAPLPDPDARSGNGHAPEQSSP